MRKSFVFLIVFILVPSYLMLQSGLQVKADLISVDYIFFNGDIITINETTPLFEAIAIKDGNITALGSTGDILGNYTAAVENTYDLEGKTIMPGIIDGHTHYMASLVWGGITLPEIYDAQELALSYGYTTLNEKSIDLAELDLFKDAENFGHLRLRLNLFPIYNYAFLDENNESTVVERWYPDHDPILDNDRMLRIPGIKIYADGASGNRGFPAMSTPYTQEMIDLWGIENPYGNLYFNDSVLKTVVDTIHDKGFSCAFHAMGDRAIETVLNATEYALNGSTNENARHQIEHNSMIRGDLITRAISQNMIHSVRGYFPTFFQKDYEALYGPTWAEWNVNRYSLPGVGLHSYLETDFTSINYNYSSLSSSRNIRPFLHLWGLVTRKAINQTGHIHEPDPWVAEHEISVEQALRMMTIEGAYAVKLENYTGSLEIGKYADLIVLSNNPITADVDDLKDIEVLLTMVGGNVEYERYPTVSEFPYSLQKTLPWLLILLISSATILRYRKKKRLSISNL
jgi:predicted amidohydrolase YtcJ